MNSIVSDKNKQNNLNDSNSKEKRNSINKSKGLYLS